MARRIAIILFVALALTACGIGPEQVDSPPATPVAVLTEAVEPIAVVAETPSVPPPTATATAVPPSPTPTSLPSPTPIPPPDDLAISPEGIFVYPAPVVYAGDEVTVQVLAHVPESLAPADVQVSLRLNGEQIATRTLNGRNLGGDAVGHFDWVWDTGQYEGPYELSVVLDPDDLIVIGDENIENNQATISVPVLPATQLPLTEARAKWLTIETQYAVIHVVSGTAAARDLNILKEMTDLAVAQASSRLEEEPERKVDVYFIDRVIGQGGYAGSSMVVSYLDRNYAGGGLYEVLVHETVHLLDQQFASHHLPFLVEGIAVWATGGHYKQEDINQRMAALREIGAYVPLAELIDNFYPVQHEIGYLQAAGFITYLVDKYGWPATRAFYADVRLEEGQLPSQAIDAALQRHFGQTLAEFEAEWTTYLDRIPFRPDAVPDLQTTVRYYDLMRRYQLAYDPTAHFLQAWLPIPQELESRNIIADVTRHPEEEHNVVLETMLQAVDGALMAGNFSRANVLLDSIERFLDSDGAFVDPVAANFQNIVQTLTRLGFRVQAIDINANQARVLARDGVSMNITELNLVLRNQNWVLLN